MYAMRILCLAGLIALSLANYQKRDSACGYEVCSRHDPNKLNVHLVCHSHNDLGWLKTVDGYYNEDVSKNLNTVVPALLKNPDRKFNQVETYYFHRWWQFQNDSVKEQVKQLINSGQLEIINGGWGSNDEANTNYQAIIDQFTLGHKWLEATFGKCSRSKMAFQIDPFGHSKEMASLYSQMGFDAFLFMRYDYRDNERRKADKAMDLMWKSSESLTNSAIFSSVVFRDYTSPDGFCFEESCNNNINDSDGPDNNVQDYVNKFTEYIKSQAPYYQTNNILITMGGDNQYKTAEVNYNNIDKLIKGMKAANPNVDGKELNVFYSSPTCYTKAVHDFALSSNWKFEEKTDDFFPFASDSRLQWTGFYTSRPTTKRFERIGNNVLQAARQINALSKGAADANFDLEDAIAIVQHHDAICGTEKSGVQKDYHRRIALGIENSLKIFKEGLNRLDNISENLFYCPLKNVSICGTTNTNSFSVLVYNPLEFPVDETIELPVDDGQWIVKDSQGILPSYVTNPIRDWQYVADNISETIGEKVLRFRALQIPPLGYKKYSLTLMPNKYVSAGYKQKSRDFKPHFYYGFENNGVTLDDVGYIEKIKVNGIEIGLKQEMMFYYSGGDASYMFDTDPNIPDAQHFSETLETTIEIQTEEVIEIKQTFSNWAIQIIRIIKNEDYIELDYVAGPVDRTDEKGRELITRFTTDLNTNGLFYTDSNGRQIMERKRNFRPTYPYTNEKPQAGNYYPLTSMIGLKDEQKRIEFAVIIDRAQGGSSLEDGQIEIMLNRANPRIELDEVFYEIEYNKGVITRGSHYITLNKMDGIPTPSKTQRKLVQRKHLAPLVLISPADGLGLGEKSFVLNELPENIHLLTLDKYRDEDNTYLIRFEHLFGIDEDSSLSQEVTFDLKEFLDPKTFNIILLEEMNLSGSFPLEEMQRLSWPQNSKIELPKDPLNTSITLKPMEIRTFLVKVK